jgi:hypothetical protein
MNEKTGKKWTYSIGDNEWCGSFDARDAALSAGKCEMMENKGLYIGIICLFLAQWREVTQEDIVSSLDCNVHDALTNIQECVCEDYGIADADADALFPDLYESEAIEELSLSWRNTFREWFKKHCAIDLSKYCVVDDNTIETINLDWYFQEIK